MDTKNLFQAFVAMMAALLIWIFVVKTFFPPPPPAEVSPQWAASQPATTTDTREGGSGTGQNPAGSASRPAQAPLAGGGAEPPTDIVLVGGDDSETAWIGDASSYREGPFRVKIQGDPRGGAIRQVLLTDYFAKVTNPKEHDQAAHLQLLRPVTDLRTGVEYLSMSTPEIMLLAGDGGQEINLGSAPWNMSASTSEPGGHSLHFDVTVRRGEQDLLEIEKDFLLPVSPIETGRYDMHLSVRVRNLSEEPVKFTMVQDGPTGMPKESKRSEERYVYGGIQGETGPTVVRWNRRGLRGVNFEDLQEGHEDRPLAWAALANKFFMVLMAPALEEGDAFGDLIAKAQGYVKTDNDDLDASADLAFRFQTSPQTLQPGRDIVFKFSCYLGPKARAGLVNNEDYARRGYITLLEKGYSSCTFVGLAKLMIFLLEFFHRILFHNYGLAIMVLVLIVRTILHPVTKKGQVNMVKMQSQMSELQPKLEEFKKKYANDKAKLNQATMELYRESGMSPAGQLFTCLPMFLQMPIWVALWTSLNYTVEMRHEPFVLWIRDLTGTDAINEWFGWHFEPFSVPILSGMIGEIDALNLLPIILSVTMYLQQRFMPKAATAHKRQSRTPDQMAQQQKIMNVMMVFFGVLFYNAPAGLNLYIMSSNIFGMIEQWRIRKHIAEQKEKGKLIPKVKSAKDAGHRPLGGFLERLQKAAEQAKRVQSQRDVKRGAGR